MKRVKRMKVMVMSGVFALVATFLPQLATLNAAPAPASAPPPYVVMGQGLQKGNSGSSRLLTTAEELDAYLKVSSCNAEVTGFLNGVDFKKEEVLIYNLLHRGSGADRPAVSFSDADSVLICKVSDSNTSMIRTMDLRITKLQFLVKVDRTRITDIDVQDRMGQNGGRRYPVALGSTMTPDAAVRILQGFPAYRDWPRDRILAARELNFYHHDLSTKDYEAITQVQGLRALNLGATDITPEKLRLLRGMPNLEMLELGSTHWQRNQLDSACLVALQGMRLKSLGLAKGSFDTAGLRALLTLPALERLDLQNVKLTPGTGLKALAQSRTLQALDIRDTHPLTADDVASLASVPSLRELRTKAPQYKALGTLRQLRLLDLEAGNTLTGNTLQQLSGLKELRTLRLYSQNPLDKQAMAVIGRMTHLENLALPYVKVNGEALATLAPLRLQRLELKVNYQIDDAGLALLAGNHPDLELLNLRYCKNITAKGATILAELKKLRVVNVYSTGITEAHLKEACPGVRWSMNRSPFMDDLMRNDIRRPFLDDAASTAQQPQ